MALFDILEQEMKDHINDFYSYGSVLPTNKYFVGFYGSYVEEALNELLIDSDSLNNDPNTPKLVKGKKIHVDNFDKWRNIHVNENPAEVALKWVVSSVSVPIVRSHTTTEFAIDSIKSIHYPLITKHDPTGTIKLNIVENRQLLFYQFFNALINKFFDGKILKPRSSFQKLSMYIVVMGEQYMIDFKQALNTISAENRDITTLFTDFSNHPRTIELVPLQVFEFNSVIIKSISDLQLSQELPAKKMEYAVTLEAPNLFQGSFKTTLSGLKNNTSDSNFLSDKNILQNNKNSNRYNTDAFEVSTSQINSRINGVFK